MKDARAGRGALLRRLLDQIKDVRLDVLVSLALGTFFLSMTVGVALLITWEARRDALREVEVTARLLLEQGRATRAYFTQRVEATSSPAGLCPIDAARELHTDHGSSSGIPYRYREAVIGAGLPENEANEAERAFLVALGDDVTAAGHSQVQHFDGEPYLVYMSPGATLDASCLRCHEGDTFALEHGEGEVLSVVSLTLPLSEPFAAARRRSTEVFLVALPFIGGFLALSLGVGNRLVCEPLKRLRRAALRIADGGDPEPLPDPAGRELRALVRAFGVMSASLDEQQRLLSARVAGRTEELDALNAKLRAEVKSRRRVERSLRQSEVRYRGLFEHSLSGIVLLRVLKNEAGRPIDFVLVDANGATKALAGLPLPTLAGRRVSEVLPDLPREFVKLVLKVVQTGRPIRVDDFLTEVGRHYALSIFAPQSEEVAVVFDDVTEREEAEAALQAYSERLAEMVDARTKALRDAQDQLVRREKLAVLGQMAGSVGHELRNPLATISNAAYVLRHTLAEPEPVVAESLAQITTQVSRSNKIIHDLLNFTRTGSVERRPTALRPLVADVIAQATPPSGVVLREEIPTALPRLFVDGQQVEQVLSNLIANACDAVPDHGTVTLRAYHKGDEVGVSVSDTGEGIPEAHMERLFEPLFTTRPGGIGLGLAVCQNLVALNEGRIEVESEVGVGTTFTVWLPTAPG
ncbi:MAG: ATP-binding protein [Anaerolineae bacterium]